MAAETDPGDLRFLLADLAVKADAGDEEAAIRLNELTGRCTSTVARAAADLAAARAEPVAPQPSLGEILADALRSGSDAPYPPVVLPALVLPEDDEVRWSRIITRVHVFPSWLRAINHIRNICAHRSRLWNRSRSDQPIPPKVGEHAMLDHLAPTRLPTFGSMPSRL